MTRLKKSRKEVVLPVAIQPLQFVEWFGEAERADGSKPWRKMKKQLTAALKPTVNFLSPADRRALLSDALAIAHWLAGFNTDLRCNPVGLTVHWDTPIRKQSDKEVRLLRRLLTEVAKVISQVNALTRARLALHPFEAEVGQDAMRKVSQSPPGASDLIIGALVQSALSIFQDQEPLSRDDPPHKKQNKTNEHILHAIFHLDVAWSLRTTEEGTRDPGVKGQRKSRFSTFATAIMSIIKPPNKRANSSYDDLIRRVVSGRYRPPVHLVELSVPRSEKDSIIGDTARRLGPKVFIDNLRSHRNAPGLTPEEIALFDREIAAATAELAEFAE